MSSYGIAILVVIELYKKWRDPWYEPTSSVVFTVFKSAFSYKDPKSMGDEERREFFFRSFIKKDRDLYGADSFYRVHNVVGLAELLTKQMRYPEAEQWYRYALRLVKHNYSEQDRRYAEVLAGLVDLHYKNGKSTEALDGLSKVIEILENSADTRELRLVYLARQAAILESVHRYDESLASLEKRLTLLLDTCPAASSNVSASSSSSSSASASDELYTELSKLVAVARLAKNQVAVERHQRHAELVLAVVIGKEGLGADSPYLSRDLRALADFYGKFGRPEFAYELRKRARALELLGRFGGPDYPGIEHDLAYVADWLKVRATGADATVAFHLEQRIKRIHAKRHLR
jgi:tetratricopeptide (TPR) repeat protein